MYKWWETLDWRYQQELQAFNAASFQFSELKWEKKKGRLEIQVACPDPENQKKNLNLIVKYPALFPYFRFEIFTNDLNLPFHQNPFIKNLCLLGRGSKNWQPSYTAAGVISSQLPKVIKTAKNPGTKETIGSEENQGEPFSDYYPKTRGITIVSDLFDQNFKGKSGNFSWFPFPGTPTSIVGVIREIEDLPYSFPTAQDSLFSFWEKLKTPLLYGKWVRVNSPPKTINAEKCFKDFSKTFDLEFDEGNLFDAIGVLFPEDGRYQEKTNGWVFLIKNKTKNTPSYYFVKGERFQLSNQFERMPEADFLSSKTVGIAGLGCIGSQAAMEFVKAHLGHLNLIDGDSLSPGNISRRPLGLMSTGKGKVEALKDFFEINFPHTKVNSFVISIGAVDPKDEFTKTHTETIKAFDDVDLIFDATAEIGVNQFLADQARKNNIPYVWAEGRNGGWGGIVGRYIPGKNGCWNCFDLHLKDGKWPTPNQKKGPLVQPVSCADPTFEGAGFDMSYISLAAVRLAVATLNSGQDSKGYPDFKWDIGIINLRDKEGRAVQPQWQVEPLIKHPKCPYCSPKK